MTESPIDCVALALFASDGMKIASPNVSIEQSCDRSLDLHATYRERALVFTKVMGKQLTKLADREIAALNAKGYDHAIHRGCRRHDGDAAMPSMRDGRSSGRAVMWSPAACGFAIVFPDETALTSDHMALRP